MDLVFLHNSIIDPRVNQVVSNIGLPFGSFPEGIAFDSTNGNMYVSNWGSNSVCVIATARPIQTANSHNHNFRCRW